MISPTFTFLLVFFNFLLLILVIVFRLQWASQEHPSQLLGSVTYFLTLFLLTSTFASTMVYQELSNYTPNTTIRTETQTLYPAKGTEQVSVTGEYVVEYRTQRRRRLQTERDYVSFELATGTTYTGGDLQKIKDGLSLSPTSISGKTKVKVNIGGVAVPAYLDAFKYSDSGYVLQVKSISISTVKNENKLYNWLRAHNINIDKSAESFLLVTVEFETPKDLK